VREAIERLQTQRVDIEILQTRRIGSVPDETMEFVISHDRTYVVAMNQEGNWQGSSRASPELGECSKREEIGRHAVQAG
jgi:cysteine sulfinate desulfinase/cysteine desulfurase-like protein